MSSYKDKFPSRFLKVDDLKGRRRLLTIESVAEEVVGSGADAEDKLIVSWKEEPKGLVLNRTNADTIAEIVGDDDVDAWPGHRVVLYPTKTSFRGKSTPCIRLEAPPTASAPPDRISEEALRFAAELEADGKAS